MVSDHVTATLSATKRNLEAGTSNPLGSGNLELGIKLGGGDRSTDLKKCSYIYKVVENAAALTYPETGERISILYRDIKTIEQSGPKYHMNGILLG